jgi:hypothetical protein
MREGRARALPRRRERRPSVSAIVDTCAHDAAAIAMTSSTVNQRTGLNVVVTIALAVWMLP